MSQSSSAARGPRGRPRSAIARRKILEAALSLLGEEGWEGLSMEGLARRAGVGKATVYRRWDSPSAVLAAAVEEMVSTIRIPDSGSVREDLLLLMTQAVERYQGEFGRLMPGLVAAMAADPDVARSVREGFLVRRREALARVIEKGVRRGELRSDIDAELALDFLGGPLFYRLLVTGAPVDGDLARGTVDVILRGLATTEAKDEGP